jgi:hypothetical protein
LTEDRSTFIPTASILHHHNILAFDNWNGVAVVLWNWGDCEIQCGDFIFVSNKGRYCAGWIGRNFLGTGTEIHLYPNTWFYSSCKRFVFGVRTCTAPISETDKTEPFHWGTVVVRFVYIPWRGTEIFESAVSGKTGSGGNIRRIFHFIGKMSVRFSCSE